MNEYVDWGRIEDASADAQLKRELTPDKSTCPVCMADLGDGDPHEPWCTEAGK